MRPNSSVVAPTLLLGLTVVFSLSGGLAFAETGLPQNETQPQVSPPPASLRLSLAEAIVLAQTHSPLVQEAAARVAGAEAHLRSARALENPTIALAHGLGQNTGGLDEDILIGQTFELSSKRRDRAATAGSQRDAALADQTTSALDLTLSVKSAYYQALRADAQYQLASDALNTARAFSEAAQTQFQAGDVARSNVLRSEIEVARSQQDLSAADADRATSYAALRSLIGDPADTNLVLTDTLAFVPLDSQLHDLQGLALRNRPDLLSGKLTLESLEHAVRSAQDQRKPDLFIEGRHASIAALGNDNSLRVGITMPLFDRGQLQAGVAAAQAAVTEQAARLSEVTRIAELEVEAAFRNLQQARNTVESFQTTRLESAEQLLDMAKTGYEKGGMTYLEVVDALHAYRSEREEYVKALADYDVALASLERAVGGQLK